VSFHFSFKSSTKFFERLWDLWCIASVVGIWPRFIEPSLIFTSHETIPIPTLPKELSGLTIVQISDLHDCNYMTKRYLKRISQHIKMINPDLIVFTGDLLSFAKMENRDLLKNFLLSLSAPLGVFAIYGNHDYEKYVSLGNDGSYRIVYDQIPPLFRGFARLFSFKESLEEGPKVTEPLNEKKELKELYQETGVQVLHNQTVQVGKGSYAINLVGLGDIMTANLNPSLAFANLNPRLPTVVLSHNPDSYPYFEYYPSDLILFGHTHGGQVNLPYIWKKITPLRDKRFKSGLIEMDNRFLYINRGLGSTFPFRWFAPPEISKFTLIRSGHVKSHIFDHLFSEERIQEAAALRTSEAFTKLKEGFARDSQSVKRDQS
jgi:uncharacterized protein